MPACDSAKSPQGGLTRREGGDSGQMLDRLWPADSKQHVSGGRGCTGSLKMNTAKTQQEFYTRSKLKCGNLNWIFVPEKKENIYEYVLPSVIDFR